MGWSRKTIIVPQEDLGKHLYLQFDGIFRDARIWINGFYLGHEPSGYATQVYDITEYLNYGEENLICVRADATLEEGWFYEGAGIYRHVWLNKTAPLHVAPFGTFVHSTLAAPFDKAKLTIETTVENSGLQTEDYRLCHILRDADGKEVARCETAGKPVLPKDRQLTVGEIALDKPHLWSVDTPYLYTLLTEVYQHGKLVDAYTTTTGIRDIRFDADKGFLLNGQPLKLKGVNMHQDHPGVGAGIPDALQVYRLKELKKFGCNAYRSSHNPMTPEMLDACDSLGILDRRKPSDGCQRGTYSPAETHDRPRPQPSVHYPLECRQRGVGHRVERKRYTHCCHDARILPPFRPYAPHDRCFEQWPCHLDSRRRGWL